MCLGLLVLPGFVLAAAILYAYFVTQRAERPLAVWPFTGFVVAGELLLSLPAGIFTGHFYAILNPGDDWADLFESSAMAFGILAAPFVGLVAFVLGAAFEQARRNRQSPFACPNCGYDLRGAASDRCSECGEPIPPSDASAGEG